jgi:hypothetical protein
VSTGENELQREEERATEAKLEKAKVGERSRKNVIRNRWNRVAYSRRSQGGAAYGQQCFYVRYEDAASTELHAAENARLELP